LKNFGAVRDFSDLAPGGILRFEDDLSVYCEKESERHPKKWEKMA